MAGGKIDIKDDQVLTALNNGLAEATAMSSLTPYIAWERVRKVLAHYHIHIPRAYLEGSDGNEVVPVSQFGLKFGETNDGDIVVNDEMPYFLYFEWEMNDKGTYTIFAEIVNEEDLDEILDDYDDEDDFEEEDEDEEEK